MLNSGGHDVSRLLVQSLVVPVRIELGQLGGHSIVITHVQRVQHRQVNLLIDPSVAGEKAEEIARSIGALQVGVVVFRREQRFETFSREAVPRLELTAGEGAQSTSHRLCAAVDEVGVNVTRQYVDVHSRSESAVWSVAGDGALKVVTLTSQWPVHRVTGWNRKGHAQRVRLTWLQFATVDFRFLASDED